MPAFYQHPMSAQLPLTPPDSGSGYGYRSMHYPHDPYSSHQSMNAPLRHDYQQPYLQPPVAPAPPPPYSYSQSSYSSTNSLPPIQNYYEPMGAPILPPLRISEGMPYANDYARRVQAEQQTVAAAQEQQRQEVKEEKATGGVSATLDYEMEMMTDFVTEAVQSIFHHTMQSQQSFRKWVHQVLSATRLPSATILLSLHYLKDRMINFPETCRGGDNQIYRLLAVSLILGSKFLDDNTFVNRSWSDVTAIKVTELNRLEMQWLSMIHYQLHVDHEDDEGLGGWLKVWKDRKENLERKQEQQKQQQMARLSPLDTTNVYRHSPYREHRSPYPSPYSAATHRSYDTPHSSRSAHFGNTSSYATSDPWGTDRHAFEDFYKRQHRYPTISEMDEANRRASEERARQALYSSYQSSNSWYQSGNYASAWDQSSWNAPHRYDCACSACSYQQHYSRPYTMAPGYAAQTVVG